MKFQYQLTEDDIYRVFSRYGKVYNIRVYQATGQAGSSAVIAFYNTQDAQLAMTDLNGKVLQGLEGILRIQWAAGSVGVPAVPPPLAPHDSNNRPDVKTG